MPHHPLTDRSTSAQSAADNSHGDTPDIAATLQRSSGYTSFMQVNILFFATLKDRAGLPRTALNLPVGATVAGLREALAAAFPGLAAALPSALVSVNHEYAFNEDALNDGDEVALFPPVSGGIGDC